MPSFPTTETGFPLDPDQYELLLEIGNGAFGKVYRAKCLYNNMLVAIKILDISDDADSAQSEIKIMKSVQHENVLELYCCFLVKCDLWLVIPLMNSGTALNIVRANDNKLPEDIIATIMGDILQGLDYLHSSGYIHRDVKAGNVLINSDGRIALADFGVATSVGLRHFNSVKHKTFVGSPCWMAPEVIQQSPYDAKIDVWSVGITALELFTGIPPYHNISPLSAIIKIFREAPPTLASYNSLTIRQASSRFTKFITRCLKKDPQNRPSVHELLSDPFIKHCAIQKDFLALLKSTELNISLQTNIPNANIPNINATNINDFDVVSGTTWQFADKTEKSDETSGEISGEISLEEFMKKINEGLTL
jgi:serine/threonine-protein kinase OSR1/STK39